jgi:hypothetical protein
MVVARADVVFADPVAVDPAPPEGAAPVVTGRVPQVGATVNAGDVVLEVAARPVFVLPGAFPAPRALGPGSNGADVVQLRAALASLGLAAGDSASQDFDEALSSAIDALYERAGYAAPGSEDPERRQAVRDAQDSVQDAKDAAAQADQALANARQALGAAPQEDKQAAEQAVKAAELALAQAKRTVERSREALEQTQRAAWTPMPLGEVVFVDDLPRRVDQVNVEVGTDLSKGAADGAVGGGTVREDGTSSQQCPVRIAVTIPEGVSEADLVGNLQATMVVGTSAEGSLVVPIAAVAANTAGQTVVEVVDGELVQGAAADQPTKQVKVVTGLSAQGLVEIKSAEPALKEGDLVVVGLAGTGQTR